jgi:WD40 repeat protein
VILDNFGKIKVYDENLNFLNSFQPHGWNIINQIKQLPNGYVATCSNDKTVKIWDPSSSPWTLLRNFTGHTDIVLSLEAINSDLIASGSQDGTIQIWYLNTGELKRTINTLSPVSRLKLLSNGVYLVGSLFQSVLNIFDINTGGNINYMMGHSSMVMDLEMIPNSDLLASSSEDLSIRLWNLTSQTCKFVLTGHTDAVYALKSISTDTLASASMDNTIKLWNVSNGYLIRTLTGHTSSILWSMDLIDETQKLVSGSIDQSIIIWNLTSSQILNTRNTGLFIQSLIVLNSIKSKKKYIFITVVSFDREL